MTSEAKSYAPCAERVRYSTGVKRSGIDSHLLHVRDARFKTVGGYRVLSPTIPPSPLLQPIMAASQDQFSDVKKSPSPSRGPVLYSSDEAYVDPKGDETLHRGLSARQVRLPLLFLRFQGILAHLSTPDLDDFSWRCCRHWSHHWIRNSPR